ncbi:MAG: endo-1,4-beta-xylanase [Cyclobacteriaceae bacterium]
MKRRKFILKSATGVAAAMMAPAIHSNSSTRIGSSNFLYGFASDSDTLNQAKKNISQVRQRDTRIQFLDKEGSPLIGKEVAVEQLSHQFIFGDNNWTMSAMVRNGMGDTDRLKYYRKRFSEIYNSLNTTLYWTERPRNDAAKTQDFQGEVKWDDLDESINWALSEQLVPKGHPMYWTVPKAIPEWLAKYPYETHIKFLEVRIRNLAARYKGKVKIWDAINEMLWEPHPKNLSKREWPYIESMDNMVDYIGKVISWAREEDPNALYTINDYGLSEVKKEGLKGHDGSSVTTQSQRKRYIELIGRLGDAGVCPNLMGIQCHTGWLSPSEQMAFYDQMSEAKIPLSVTEFWARTSELKKKANKAVESEEWRSFGNNKNYDHLSEEELEEIRDQFVVDYLTCAFAHPNIHSFYFWGLMGSMVKFRNGSNSGHQLTPLYHKIKDLIHNQWKTRLTVKADKKGFIDFRGYCGQYSARLASAGGPDIGHYFSVNESEMLNSHVIKTVL